MTDTATRSRPGRPASPGAANTGRRAHRVDIQQLRALAVGVVVVFHLWPSIMPGGYVGVDVFFVISGFLITGQLLAEAAESGRIRLGRFWARRVRRLLPAAIVVILATLSAAWFFLPREVFRETAEHAIGSALYVENWLLARDAVDYLAAENDPSPFQHYWSLSVEEQFYLVWPFLVLAGVGIAALIARRAGAPLSSERRLSTVGVVLGAVTLASLAASVLLTATAPEQAYFATHVRAWEFGAGGLVAWALRRGAGAQLRARTRRLLWWVGVAAVALSALLFTADTPFPGTAALLPVLGTALALAARPAARVSRDSWILMTPTVGNVAGRAAAQLGEWSYSLYLWHWPVIVIALALGDGPIGPARGLVILVSVVALAAASERWIERPFRTGRAFTAPWTAISILFVGSLLVVAPAATAIVTLQARFEAEQAELDKQLSNLGANADAPSEDTFAAPSGPELFPDLLSRKDDTGGQYECYANKGEEYTPCGYGDPGAEVRIALVGDSHAASLIRALEPIVEERGWRLDVMSGNYCRLVNRPACAAGADMIEAIESGDYDVVLATAIRRAQGSPASVVREWRALLSRGVPIVPITDVPHFPEATNECLEGAADAHAAEECWTSAADAGADRPDSYGAAGTQLGLPVIDLTHEFCRDGRCPAVIGNVIVYRDSPASHITATFSRTLSSALEEQLLPIVTASVN